MKIFRFADQSQSKSKSKSKSKPKPNEGVSKNLRVGAFFVDINKIVASKNDLTSTQFLVDVKTFLSRQLIVYLRYIIQSPDEPSFGGLGFGFDFDFDTSTLKFRPARRLVA